MVVEDPQMLCRHCWNKVERIKYRDDGARTPGAVENVWKHIAGSLYQCSISPITDGDVMPESEMESGE